MQNHMQAQNVAVTVKLWEIVIYHFYLWKLLVFLALYKNEKARNNLFPMETTIYGLCCAV